MDATKMNLTSLEVARAKRKAIKAKMMRLMENNWVVLVVLLVTLWALLGTDVWVLADLPKETDEIAYGLSFFSFLVFSLEWMIACWAQEGYWGSFFFYLDFIATISLIPDVVFAFGVILIDSNQLTFARAGRAARAGTRAVRFVRIFKILSLIKKKRGSKDSADQVQLKPSKVGSKLMDLITQKVIVIVAVMLIMTSIVDSFSADTEEGDHLVLANLEHLYMVVCTNTSATAVAGARVFDCPPDPMDVNLEGETALFRDSVASFLTMNSDPLDGVIYMNIDGRIITPDNFYALYVEGDKAYPWSRLREQPAQILRTTLFTTWEDGTSHLSTMIRTAVKKEQLSSLTEILKIFIVILVLGISSWLFSRDSQRLVIDPLEKMANLVERLVNNPLMNVDDDIKEVKVGNKSEEGEMETEFVENSLKKFVKLLQIAFGEAGAEIIGKNLAAGDELNPMIRGRKVMGTYGFCDIRNFTDCTECLEERVMPFVNGIAHYVHTATKENAGAPNKNIGDAFLLVWRSTNPDAHIDAQLPIVGDLPLRAFTRMVLECCVDAPLSVLTNDPKIQARIPGYRTKMGFGLHYGWSVEGAIGSILKIDASYLSPHVNMAARLEGATKSFGVIILLSESFYGTITPKVKALCRRIDRLTPKGSDKPIELYTYDLPVPHFGDKLPPTHDDNFWENFPPVTSASFRREFAAGLEAYLDGKWDVAAAVMRQCLAQRKDDGPAQNLIEIMEEYNFVAPVTWKGYREKVDM